MNYSLLLQLYFGIGFIYWVVNTFWRKLEVENDWGLPMLWFFFWWVCFIALFIQFIQKVKHKL